MASTIWVAALYRRVFGRLERALEPWFLGLAARFVFAGVLLVYYWNSAMTKLGSGFPAMFVPGDGAYFQILPPVMEAYNYDASAIPVFPYGLIVFAGTYAEVLLPLLVTLGLFTRLAALGMIGFIAVQTFVDIVYLGVEPETIGALFDGQPGAAIADQRTLWVFVLLYLVVKGAGAVSFDGFLARLVARSRPATA